MSTQLQYVPFSGMVVYQTQDSSGNDEYVFDSVVKFGSGNATTITSDGVTANYVYAHDISGGDLTQSCIIRANEMKANSFSGGSFDNNTMIKASNFSGETIRASNLLTGSTIKASNFSGWDMSMTICGETYIFSGIHLGLAGSDSDMHEHTYLILHNPNSVAGQTETESES